MHCHAKFPYLISSLAAQLLASPGFNTLALENSKSAPDDSESAKRKNEEHKKRGGHKQPDSDADAAEKTAQEVRSSLLAILHVGSVHLTLCSLVWVSACQVQRVGCCACWCNPRVLFLPVYSVDMAVCCIQCLVQICPLHPVWPSYRS